MHPPAEETKHCAVLLAAPLAIFSKQTRRLPEGSGQHPDDAGCGEGNGVGGVGKGQLIVEPHFDFAKIHAPILVFPAASNLWNSLQKHAPGEGAG